MNKNLLLKAGGTGALILALVILFFPKQAESQRNIVLNMPNYDQELFHFGFVLGVNQSFVTIRPIANLNSYTFTRSYMPEDILPTPDSARVLSVSARSIPGFVISILANMRMGDHFDLRFLPSLAFGDRTLEYNIKTFTAIPGGTDSALFTKTKKVPSTYISFPLEIRYKAFRYNNFRPYLLVGAQYSLDLASNAKKREAKNRDEKIVKFNASDFYAEAGVGFDFYNEWFKFGVELKMMYGFLDVLKHENNIYTESIEKLNSKIFQLSLTFE
ncbi:MAG: PorT family protein [Alphaproteobacteria bacterium]|nr:PorT family protein [Alphaproteobacteria bacterium]